MALLESTFIPPWGGGSRKLSDQSKAVIDKQTLKDISDENIFVSNTQKLKNVLDQSIFVLLVSESKKCFRSKHICFRYTKN